MTRGSQTDESVYQQQQCERSKKLALSAPERHVKMHLRSSQQPTFDQLHHFLDERRADLSLFLADERAACQPLPRRKDVTQQSSFHGPNHFAKPYLSTEG